jgi:hypothetical protein
MKILLIIAVLILATIPIYTLHKIIKAYETYLLKKYTALETVDKLVLALRIATIITGIITILVIITT